MGIFDGDDSVGFKVGTIGGAAAAAFAGRKAITVLWKAATGSEPPVNPEDPEVEWKEAVAWALVSGAVIGLARLVASRQAAVWFRKRTGHLPSNLQEASS